MIPKIPDGKKRQWVRCKQCGCVAYYDYVPHSLANPVMLLTCGHGVGSRLLDVAAYISEAEALRYLRTTGGDI